MNFEITLAIALEGDFIARNARHGLTDTRDERESYLRYMRMLSAERRIARNLADNAR